MRKLLSIALIMFVIVGCKQGSEKYAVSEMVLTPPPLAETRLLKPNASASSYDKNESADSDQDNSAVTQSVSKKIIKEGEISFETDDLKKARRAIANSLQKLGGYIDEENEDNNANRERKEYTLKVRIPAQNFEKFLNTVSSNADRIESKSIRIKDVTTEFIDISIRLNNKKLLEERYKGLLAKAGKMADILEVENKLNEIRTDIETTQGQLNYLNKQIAYSSLAITFLTRSAVGKNEGNGFGYKFKLALTNSWELLQDIFFGLITAWPLILISIIVVIVLKRYLKKRKAKQV